MSCRLENCGQDSSGQSFQFQTWPHLVSAAVGRLWNGVILGGRVVIIISGYHHQSVIIIVQVMVIGPERRVAMVRF